MTLSSILHPQSVLAVDAHSLSSDDSRHSAIQTAVKRACAFWEDLQARPSAGVFGFDLEQRVILVVSNRHQRIEDCLFGQCVSVYRLKEIDLVISNLVWHISSLQKNAAHCLLESREEYRACKPG